MPAASEVKKIDQSWESKVTDISTGNLWGDLEQINRAILDCNEAVTDAGLGGISYVSQNSEIQRRMNAIGIMEEYVMGIRSALQQQLDDPLFDGFNKKATETLSRIHPEKFETANTLGLTVTLGASGHGESYSSKETKDHLDLYDFLGYTVGNYSEYGCLHTESMECVQDFADMFKADYDAVSKSGALKGSSVKSLDDYLKNLVSGGDFSHHMDQPFKSFLSGLLDITIVKPIIDACTGYDCVTGEDLSNTEQSLDLLFAAVSLIPFAGVAGKAIDIGGKEGALFLGKRVAVDCVSYATSYSALKLAEQKGLDPRINVLISLGIGITVTKVAGKYLLKDAKGAIFHEIPTGEEEKSDFAKNIDSILDKQGITLDEFNSLRLKDVATLSDNEKAKLKAIRESIPMPDSNTEMQKVIPAGDIQKYLNGTYDQVGGYIARADDVSHLKTYEDIRKSLRLDYPNSAYNPKAGSLGVIRFKTPDSSQIKIPYSQEMGGTTKASQPFTGNGFTKSTNGQIIPEFKANKRMQLSDGSELYELKNDGTITQVAVYSEADGHFIMVK